MSWLPNSVTKGFLSPKIVWEPVNDKYGGYYSLGGDKIVATEQEGEDAILAHEFRHYTQERIGTLKKVTSFLDFSIPYEDMIRKYFRSSWYEYDALLFEYKHAKTENNEWWLKKLVWED